MKCWLTILSLSLLMFTSSGLATAKSVGKPVPTKGTSTGNAFTTDDSCPTGTHEFKKASKTGFILTPQCPTGTHEMKKTSPGQTKNCKPMAGPGTGEVYFDGACRDMAWLQANLASSDATLLHVAGSAQATKAATIGIAEVTQDGIIRTFELSDALVTADYDGKVKNTLNYAHQGYDYQFAGEIILSADSNGDLMVTSESTRVPLKGDVIQEYSEMTIFSGSHWMLCNEDGCVDAMALNGDECAMMGVQASSEFMDQCLESYMIKNKSTGLINLPFSVKALWKKTILSSLCGASAMHIGNATEKTCNEVYAGDASGASAMDISEELGAEPEVEDDEVDLKEICDDLTNTELGYMVQEVNGDCKMCDRVVSTHCEPSLDDETCDCETFYGPWDCSTPCGEVIIEPQE